MEKKFYIVTVVGSPRPDKPDVPKFMRDAQTPAGFTFTGPAKDKRSFFHLELMEDAETTVKLKNGKTVNISNPQMKPFTFNCFERSHPELFKAILREIKSHTEEKPTYTKDIGDKTGMRIILDNFAAHGAIASFELPYEVYRMNRDPKTHKLVHFEAQSYAPDGTVRKLPQTTTTGQTFLYGNEVDAADVFIKKAIMAVLKSSKKVEVQTHIEDTGSATVNTSVSEEPENTETAETTDTTTKPGDDGDI